MPDDRKSQVDIEVDQPLEFVVGSDSGTTPQVPTEVVKPLQFVVQTGPATTTLDDKAVRLDYIKRLGEYIGAKNTEEFKKITELFFKLQNLIKEDSTNFYYLDDNKEIELRFILQGEKHDDKTVFSYNGFPSDDTVKNDLKGRLFFSDVVLLLLDIAVWLQKEYRNSVLIKYEGSFNALEELQKIGSSEGTNLVSILALEREKTEIVNLVASIFYAIQEIERLYFTETEKREEKAATVEESPAETPEVAENSIVESVAQETAAAEEGAGGDESQPIEEKIPEELAHLRTQTEWVVAFSRQFIFDQFLQTSGIPANALPAELQLRLRDLDRILRTEAWTVVNGLPPEILERLANQTASFAERIIVFQKLLIHLQSGSNLGFTELLSEMYRQYLKEVAAKQPAAATTISSEVLQFYQAVAVPDAQTSPEAAKVLTEIKTRIENALIDVKTTAPAEEAAAEDQTVEEAPTELAPEMATAGVVAPFVPVHVQLSNQQLDSIETRLGNISTFSAVEQKQIQNQSARLVWGALTQLLGDTSNIPPEILAQASEETIEYMFRTMSADELRRLAKSPSRLLAHIRQLALELQRNPQLLQFIQEREAAGRLDSQATQTDRAALIEQQTDLSTNVIIDTIFTENRINDATVPDGNGLQNNFDDIKAYIRESVFASIFELPTTDILAYSRQPLQSTQLFTLLEDRLQKDPQFRQILRVFLTRYLQYVALYGVPGEFDELEKKLRSFLTDEGTLPGLKDEIEESLKEAEQLLEEQGVQQGAETPSEVTEAPIIEEEREPTEQELAAGAAVAGTHPQVLRQVGTGAFHKEQTTPAGTVETETPNIRKRKEILVELLSTKWNSLQAEEKVLVYLHYNYPVPRALRKPNPNLEQVNQYCVLIPEFLGFNPDLLPVLKKDFENSAKAKGTAAKTISATEVRLAELQNQGTHRFVLPESLQRLTAEERQQLIAILQDQTKQSILEQLLLADYEALQQQLQVANIQELLQNEAFNNDLRLAAALEGIQSLENLPPKQIAQLEATDAAAGVGGVAGGIFSRFRKKTNPVQQLKDTLLSKVSPSEAAKKAAANLATSALSQFVTSAGNLVTTSIQLLRNKKFRELAGTILMATGLLASNLLGYAFSTVGGSLAFVGTFLASFIPLGPIGALMAATAAGALGSYLVPIADMPFQFRMAPGPWDNFFGNRGEVGTKSMAQMRSENARAASSTSSNPLSQDTDSARSTASTTTASNAISQVPAQPTPTLTTPTAPTPPAITTPPPVTPAFNILTLPIGIIAPVLGLTAVAFTATVIMTVIMGAFLVPLPTRPGSPRQSVVGGEQASAKYVTVTKTPSIGTQVGQIQNHTNVPITYSISINPKPGYSLKITNVTDQFSAFGENTQPSLTSTLDTTKLATTEPVATGLTTAYVVSTGTGFEDAILTNTLTVSFDVYDATGYVIESNQSYVTAASVYIGKPKVGCWPTSGIITTKPFDSTVSTHVNADAFDIAANIGSKVYAPFNGTINGSRTFDTGGYGNYVILEFMSGSERNVLVFGHLSAIAPEFKGRASVPVSAGQVIGYVGSTGNSTGPHLHYELFSNVKSPPSILVNLVPGGRSVDHSSHVTSCFGQ